ncbi:uncharacterized protein LOC113351672 [Papaver somniferum]|uniref:uncharacterized protein LOC113351672 n=1 Tax=Papaver somniferum TaxID=3469 RepID=UPI000E7048DC|nr:uncharacterized protein LOC113351672 [Papaver somniferum]
MTSGLTVKDVRYLERMKLFADKTRTDRTFEVGDHVYLKLQPYRQSSIAARRNFKFSTRYYGPFTILDKIGHVAHKLDLPIQSKIHHVLHVSQLKKKIGASATTIPILPLVDDEGEIVFMLVATLDFKQLTHRDIAADLFLKNIVKYLGFPHDIVSDRDSQFTGRFWTALFGLLGSELI